MEYFEQIILVGTTKILYECAKVAMEKYTDLPVYILDIKKDQGIEAYKQGIDHTYMEKQQLIDFLKNIDKKTLVMSIMNKYIIPKCVINNKNLIILNLHHALLPQRPGRNPETWAIWEQDGITGVTWHFVDVEVDSGDIIIQREIPIEENDTALSLFRKENVIAKECLKEILPLDNLEKLHSRKQDKNQRGELKYASQAPNDGYLDLTWDMNVMKRFLRAMNYGVPDFFMSMKVNIGGVEYSFYKYSMREENLKKRDRNIYVEQEKGIIEISENNEKIIIKGIKKEESKEKAIDGNCKRIKTVHG